MPCLGFGTAGLGDATERSVELAFQHGYRLFDSAQAREWYREDAVGRALQSVERQSLFFTTKIHPRHLGYAPTAERIKHSLRDLRTTYLDLILLHYPECWGQLCEGQTPSGDWRHSWRALEDAHRLGTVRALGISNVDAPMLQELVAFAHIPPSVVQAHSDPLHPNTALQAVCAKHAIVFQGYSTLGSQHRGLQSNPVLTAPSVVRAAQTHKVSPAQVVLRWALHHGQCVIPRTRDVTHMIANLQLDGFALTLDELRAIDALDEQSGHSRYF